MQMVKKILLGMFVTWIGFLAFMPKTELYYLLEKELVKNDIRLNEKSIDEGIFSLSLKGVTLFAKGIHIANIEEIKIMTLLGYTHLSVEGVTFDALLKGQAPKKIKNIDISHSVLSLTNIDIEGNGTMGELEGVVRLSDRKVRINFKEGTNLNSLRTFLKKDKKGWYYEKAF